MLELFSRSSGLTMVSANSGLDYGRGNEEAGVNDMAEPLPDELVQSMEAHFDEMIRMQREKVLRMARRRIPHLTADDILNPHDYPELVRDADFNFEDGILAGLISAQIGLRARFFRCQNPPS